MFSLNIYKCQYMPIRKGLIIFHMKGKAIVYGKGQANVTQEIRDQDPLWILIFNSTQLGPKPD